MDVKGKMSRKSCQRSAFSCQRGTGEPQRALRTQRSEDITGSAMGAISGQLSVVSGAWLTAEGAEKEMK